MSEFIREVDEDYRRDQMLSFWKRYGWLLLLGAGLIILAVAGYTYYAQAKQRELEDQATAFIKAQQLAKLERPAEALSALDDLLDGKVSPGYRALAGLSRAKILAQQGKTSEAIAAYEAVSTDMKVPQTYRHLATITHAGLIHSSRTAEELKTMLDAVLASDDYRHSAEELIAAALLREGNTSEALSYLRRIRQAEEAPRTLKARAQTLLEAYEEEDLPDISGALVEDVDAPGDETGAAGE